MYLIEHCIHKRLAIVPAVLLFTASSLSTFKDVQQVKNGRLLVRRQVVAKAPPSLVEFNTFRVQEPDNPVASTGQLVAGPPAPATATATATAGDPGLPVTSVAEPAAVGIAGEGAAVMDNVWEREAPAPAPVPAGEAPAGGAPAGEAPTGEAPLAAEGTAGSPVQSADAAEAADSAGVAEGTTVEKKESNHLGAVLLGFVSFMVTLFYGVHYHDADVRFSVWCTLQDVISLLCGVLIFHAFKDCMVMQFGETDNSENHEPPNLKSLIVSFVRLLIAFWLSQFVLLRYRKDEKKLMAWGMVLGNVVAFASIDSLGMIQQVAPFADNPANAFLGVLVASLMMFCMSVSGHIVRQYWMTFETGTISEEEAKWDHQCEHTEDHFSGIAVGMLLSIVIRYSITGEMPPIWGAPKDKTERECIQLFSIALALSVPIFFVSLAFNTIKKGTEGNKALKWIIRCMKVFQTTLAMTMGWSLMYALRWQWWMAKGGEGEVMTARLMLALIFSYVGFIFIVVVDRIGDKVKVGKEGFIVVNEAFGLGIGMSWEGAFSQAVDEFAADYGSSGDAHARAYVEVILAMFLVILILPAWVWYILPKVLAGPEGEKEKKPEGTEGEESAGEQAALDNQAAGEGEAVDQGEDVAKTATEQAPPAEESGGVLSAAGAGEDPGGWDGHDQGWADGGQGDQGWDDGGWGGGNASAGGGRTNQTWAAGGKGRGADGKGGRGGKASVEDDNSASF